MTGKPIPPPDPTTFGAALRAARQSAGFTLGQVAKELGVSVSHLSNVETGTKNPLSLEKTLCAAKVLGVDPSKLVHLSGRLDPATLRWVASIIRRCVSADIESEGRFDLWAWADQVDGLATRIEKESSANGDRRCSRCGGLTTIEYRQKGQTTIKISSCPYCDRHEPVGMSRWIEKESK